MTTLDACLACGGRIHVLLVDESVRPLSTQAWPATEEGAHALPFLPHRFVRCVSCGHVWNHAFSEAHVEGPVHMFNGGTGWSRFVDKQAALLTGYLCERPQVVEVGHGDGSFLRRLRHERPKGVFIGIDPSPSGTESDQIVCRRFEPALDMNSLRPDLLILRHVLEHLSDPVQTLQETAYECSLAELSPLVYLEVPCVEGALQHGRASDLIYEHCSHFTARSFDALLARIPFEMVDFGLGYEDEILWALIRLETPSHLKELLEEIEQFRSLVREGTQRLRLELNQLSRTRVVVWGGTGKAAAFLNRHGMDSARFPLVVDSDSHKVGTHVPGTGQAIQSPAILLKHTPDVVLIPSQWRAADIVDEVAQMGLVVPRLLIEHRGRLIDWMDRSNPYSGRSKSLLRMRVN